MMKLPIFILLLAGTVFARSAKNDLVHLDYIKDLAEHLINERDAIYDSEFDPEEFDRILVVNEMIGSLEKLKTTPTHIQTTAKGKKGSIQARDSIINDLIEDLKFMQQDYVDQYSDSQVIQSNLNFGRRPTPGHVIQIKKKIGFGRPALGLVSQSNLNFGPTPGHVIQIKQKFGGRPASGVVSQSNQNFGGTPVSQSNING